MPSEELEQLKAARPRKEFGDSHIGYSIDLDAWADSIIAYAEKVTAENDELRDFRDRYDEDETARVAAERPALRVSLRGEPFAEGSLRNRFNRTVGD